MNKYVKAFSKLFINLCFFIALGITGNGIILMFFGEPTLPAQEITRKISETHKQAFK